MTRPSSVRIREVAPRDGIQSEKADISTAQKIGFIDALAGTGLKRIEAVSFVSPRAIPQMADAAEVYRGITRKDGVFYSALVPNATGAERAVEVGVDGLQVFVAASESYNLRNVRRSVEESLQDVREVVVVAANGGTPVEGTIATSFGCPYEGDVPPARVVDIATHMHELGIAAISFGDTTGMATPRRIEDVVATVRTELPELDVNLHLHDTRGTGLANVLAGVDLGVDYFDASVGGMGGSPYAAGATGNICTEDLVHMLDDMGIATGVELDALIDVARMAQDFVSGELPSKMLKAGPRSRVAGPVRPVDVGR